MTAVEASVSKLLAAKVLPTASTALLTFTASEATLKNLPIALFISAICSAVVAYISTRPRMIKAQSDAHASATAEWARLLQQANDHHAHDVARLEKIVDRQKVELILTRISKHNALDAYGAACLHIQNVEELAKAAGFAVPKYVPRRITEITEAEDRHMLAISQHLGPE